MRASPPRTTTACATRRVFTRFSRNSPARFDVDLAFDITINSSMRITDARVVVVAEARRNRRAKSRRRNNVPTSPRLQISKLSFFRFWCFLTFYYSYIIIIFSLCFIHFQFLYLNHFVDVRTHFLLYSIFIFVSYD